MFLEQLKQFSQRKKIALAISFVFVFLLVIAAGLNIRLGFDTQNDLCLPYRVMLVRYHYVEDIQRGDILVFNPSRIMGEQFKNSLVFKKVAGLPGDEIQIKAGAVYVNGKFVSQSEEGVVGRAAKYLNVESKSFDRLEKIPNGKVLMLGESPKSFDGRFWGFLSKDEILGTVYPIF